ADRYNDPLWPKEPWPDPVSGDELLGELCDVVRRHIVMPEEHVRVLALWILFAHTHDAWQHSPFLVLSSPVLECGKTTVVGLLTRLVPKPLPTTNITPA